MAKVPQAMSSTWQTTQTPPSSQPRDLDSKLRSDVGASFLPFEAELNSPCRNIARAICLVFNQRRDENVTTSSGLTVNVTHALVTDTREIGHGTPFMTVDELLYGIA
jgi:hypothetical protein